MSTFANILVPTDFGETSTRALATACALATSAETKITLLHVFEPLSYYGYGSSLFIPMEELLQEAQRRVDQELATLRKMHRNAHAVLASGMASERICTIAHQSKADLIVMGTQGRTGLSRAILGSVAETVVRESSVPVLTVGPARKNEAATNPAPAAPVV